MSRKFRSRVQDAPPENHFIDEHEFARRFGIGVSTARRWRQDGSGPPFRRLNGKLVRYSWPDVIDWLDERSPKVTSTTQADAVRTRSRASARFLTQ